MTEEKICFVICPIGDENTPIRKRSDQIFKHIIEPVVKEDGYKCLRSDHIPSPGLITSQAIEHLINSDLVIADLSGHNPNVFYELAIRHAIQKPFIQLIERGDNIPFDISGLRTISIVTKEFDLDNIEHVKKEIIAQIKTIEKNDKIINPIFETLRIKLAKNSENIEQIKLGDIYEEMQNIKLEIANMNKVSKPDEAVAAADRAEAAAAKAEASLMRLMRK